MYCSVGLSTIGSISFGCAFVAGKNLVPRPAAGIIAFLILFSIYILPPLYTKYFILNFCNNFVIPKEIINVIIILEKIITIVPTSLIKISSPKLL